MALVEDRNIDRIDKRYSTSKTAGAEELVLPITLEK
jgi:hypothetical protein